MAMGAQLESGRGRRRAAPRPAPLPETDREGGFTLVEALVTIFILTMILLSLGQLIGMGMVTSAGAEDLTTATGLSTAKLEELRSGDYWALTAGGDLDSDTGDYFDEPDVDGDGEPDFTRRWQITDQPNAKLIQVRVISTTQAIGEPKRATMAALIGEP